jgi:CRISPR/Cas system-associated exonuclease Cas4 (RecB family)
MEQEQRTPSFVERDRVSRELEELLRDANEKRSIKAFVSSLDPSSLVECPRRLFYKTTSSYVSSASYFENQTQHFTITKWISYLDRCRGVRVVEKNVCSADGNYHIHGYLPAVIEFQHLMAGVLVKGVNNEQFSEIKKKGVVKKDVVELMIYLWLLEIQDGLLIYDDLGNQDYRIFHVVGYKPIIESVKRKCLEIISCQKEGRPPSRPYRSKTRECKQCEFLRMCWKESDVKEQERNTEQ